MLERCASRGVGIDLSPGMVKRARTLAAGDPRLTFHVAAGDALPLADDGVSHVLSVESLYYYPDPGAALREWARVAAPGAQLGIMIDLYRENPGSHPWIEALRPSGVRVHLLGASELAALAEAAGWAEPRWRQVVDPPGAHRSGVPARRVLPNLRVLPAVPGAREPRLPRDPAGLIPPVHGPARLRPGAGGPGWLRS